MESQPPPIPETDEERERRERLEFFMAHSPSEIIRLAIAFHEAVQSGVVDRWQEISVHKVAA